MYKLISDVIVFPVTEQTGQLRWVIMNVFARTSLGVSGEVISKIDELLNTDTESNEREKNEKQYCIWEIERFSNYDGLLADPTRIERDLKNWKKKEVDISELKNIFAEKSFIVKDYEKYLARFNNKINILDKEHYGNFHQQLGWELFVNHREQPSKFWVRQKFNDDLLTVRNESLYYAIQFKFLEKYFKDVLKQDKRVLDIGCGTGIYSNIMSKYANEVIGVDPSDEYLQIAQKNCGKNVKFLRKDVGKDGALDDIESNSIDFVFISDTLLFYFVPFQSGEKADITVLLKDIFRVLKKDGVFISLEPHYIFWLQPWLGSNDRPFTILTENANKKYSPTPNLSEFIKVFTDGNFCVKRMLELIPDEYFKEIDPRGYYFAKEFPLWHLFELIKSPF